ncbi:MAG: hypothetical protein AAFO80_17320 [Pseudomonadota bacterium]
MTALERGAGPQIRLHPTVTTHHFMEHLIMTRTKLLTVVFIAGLAMLVSADAQDMSAEDRQKMLENVTQADRNDDGAISRSEFETLIDLNAADALGRAARVKSSGRFGMVFNRLDANGDGFLTQQEMQEMAEARG